MMTTHLGELEQIIAEYYVGTCAPLKIVSYFNVVNTKLALHSEGIKMRCRKAISHEGRKMKAPSPPPREGGGQWLPVLA